jgi:lipocalin
MVLMASSTFVWWVITDTSRWHQWGPSVGTPKNVKPVDNFKVEKYLGKWYEIARLDHSFERGLSHATADYKLPNDSGEVNRG